MPLEEGEAPFVDNLDDDSGKGFGQSIGEKLGLRKSPIDGTVRRVTETHVDIVGPDGKNHTIELHRYFPHARKTHTTDRALVKEGDVIKAGQPVAHSNYVDPEGRLSMGKNLSVAFMAAPRGDSFEDCILISESAAKKLSSQHLYGYDVEHKQGVQSDKKRFMSLFPNKYTNEQLEKFTDDGMLKPGAIVNPGDPVFLSFAPRSLSSKDAALGNLHKVLRNSHVDMSQTWEKSTPGTVTDAVRLRSGLRLNIATIMPLADGDKVSARQGAKGVVKLIPDDQMVRDEKGEPVEAIINTAALRLGRATPERPQPRPPNEDESVAGLDLDYLIRVRDASVLAATLADVGRGDRFHRVSGPVLVRRINSDLRIEAEQDGQSLHAFY